MEFLNITGTACFDSAEGLGEADKCIKAVAGPDGEADGLGEFDGDGDIE